MQSFLVRKDNRASIFVKGLILSCDGAIFVDDQIWRSTHDHPEFLSDRLIFWTYIIYGP